MSIGHSPNVEPYKPDMKKDEANITMEDRQEARRRIEGSLAPEMDNMNMLPQDTGVGGVAGAMNSLNPLNPANIS
jgi:hypothetical protein